MLSIIQHLILHEVYTEHSHMGMCTHSQKQTPHDNYIDYLNLRLGLFTLNRCRRFNARLIHEFADGLFEIIDFGTHVVDSSEDCVT